MSYLTLKKIPIWCLFFCSCLASAEGIIDAKPYIGTNLVYDDNVFRFSSPDQAEFAFGSPETADLIKRLDLGVNVDLRLSRQLVKFSANASDSRYNRFDLLDNVAKSYRLNWDWRLGNDFYGILTTSKSESIAGFTEIRNPVKNTRIVDRQSASVNWRFHPDWSVYALGEQIETKNELIGFDILDRDDDITETGVRYRNPLGTQISLFYRVVDSEFPKRTEFAAFLFGDESVQSALTLEAAWQPTMKTRINARLARVTIEYENTPQREFSGFSQRWDISHNLTSKFTFNGSVYREVSPIDDIVSTFVESTGVTVNSIWSITSKVLLRGGVGYQDVDYLGNSGIIGNGFFITAVDRRDISKTANLGLIYTPTLKSVLQLQYQGEDRESTLNNQTFRFNTLSFVAQYNF